MDVCSLCNCTDQHCLCVFACCLCMAQIWDLAAVTEHFSLFILCRIRCTNFTSKSCIRNTEPVSAWSLHLLNYSIEFVQLKQGCKGKGWQENTYLDTPVPCGTMGSRFCQHTRSAAIVSFSLQLTPLACRSSLNVDRKVFFGRPLFLLPSAGVHSIARQTGHSGAIRMTWPANWNLLAPTMSCSRLCPEI